jgi:hypothetical protein
VVNRPPVPSFQSYDLVLFHIATTSTSITMFKLYRQLGLILGIIILTRSMPLSSKLSGQMFSRNSYSSPANPTCHLIDIAIDTTIFENYAAAFCADVTKAQRISQNIALMLNQTLTMAVNVTFDAVKYQVTPGGCISAMRFIRMTCEYPFPGRLAPKHLSTSGAIHCVAGLHAHNI